MPVTAVASRAYEPRHKPYLASRLPHLELCARLRALLAGADGVYDPTEYADRLVLGLTLMMVFAHIKVTDVAGEAERPDAGD